MSRAIVLLLLVIGCSQAMAFEWRELWQRKDQQAHKLLENGDPQAAVEMFDDSNWRGVSHYRAGNFEAAQAEFAAAEDVTSVYNRGVSEVRGGQYQQAIESFEQVLAQDALHEDAKHNLAIAKELAKQQKDQQENQQNSDQDSDQENSEEKNNEAQDSEEQKSEQGSEEQTSNQDQSESAEQSPGEDQQSQQSQSEMSSDQQQSGSESDGELSEESVNPTAEQLADEQAQEELRQQLQQQFEAGGEASEEDSTEQQVAVPVQESLTEDQQATEQWLRLIPDDPSQLLRNKIKLNHMLEHSDVRDTKEPW